MPRTSKDYRILAFTPEGESKGVFRSSLDIQKELKIDPSNLSKVLNGKVNKANGLYFYATLSPNEEVIAKVGKAVALYDLINSNPFSGVYPDIIRLINGHE